MLKVVNRPKPMRRNLTKNGRQYNNGGKTSQQKKAPKKS